MVDEVPEELHGSGSKLVFERADAKAKVSEVLK